MGFLDRLRRIKSDIATAAADPSTQRIKLPTVARKKHPNYSRIQVATSELLSAGGNSISFIGLGTQKIQLHGGSGGRVDLPTEEEDPEFAIIPHVLSSCGNIKQVTFRRDYGGTKSSQRWDQIMAAILSVLPSSLEELKFHGFNDISSNAALQQLAISRKQQLTVEIGCKFMSEQAQLDHAELLRNLKPSFELSLSCLNDFTTQGLDAIMGVLLNHWPVLKKLRLVFDNHRSSCADPAVPTTLGSFCARNSSITDIHIVGDTQKHIWPFLAGMDDEDASGESFHLEVSLLEEKMSVPVATQLSVLLERNLLESITLKSTELTSQAATALAPGLQSTTTLANLDLSNVRNAGVDAITTIATAIAAAVSSTPETFTLTMSTKLMRNQTDASEVVTALFQALLTHDDTESTRRPANLSLNLHCSTQSFLPQAELVGRTLSNNTLKELSVRLYKRTSDGIEFFTSVGYPVLQKKYAEQWLSSLENGLSDSSKTTLHTFRLQYEKKIVLDACHESRVRDMLLGNKSLHSIPPFMTSACSKETLRELTRHVQFNSFGHDKMLQILSPNGPFGEKLWPHVLHKAGQHGLDILFYVVLEKNHDMRIY